MTPAALKILLLDDDEDEFVILKGVLARAGGQYSLDWTADVDRAMADVRRAGHDLYLVDYRLGPVTGVDVIRRSIEAGAKAPMILLTGTGAAGEDGEIDLEALRAGAADYLDKQELTPKRLDRAIRYARERVEAARLRRAGERSSFLAEASALLASSLDYETVLENLTRLAVPKLADWCSVEMVEGDDVKHLAVAHTDPEKVHWALELRRKYPPERGRPQGLWQVLRTGRPELYPEITKDLLEQSAVDPAHLEIMRQIGMKSALIVPLIAGGKPLGGITLVWAESGHGYEQADLDLVMEVAHRAALAVENARLYRDLQAAVQARDDFLAIAGHELKTPLAALLIHVQGLERSARDDAGVSPKIKQRLEKAAASGKRLEKLIVEMLDVSRVTAGRLKLEPGPVQLDELVREVVERFGEQAARSGSSIALHLEPGVSGVWDRLRIDQVVTNLVSNALKYGQGKPVGVEARRRGGQAVLRVVDHGIGIQLDQQRKIFERFERAVATREYGGFGLGLWIAREIVEASGGKIEVDSEPDRGATFTVTLPLRPEGSHAPS